MTYSVRSASLFSRGPSSLAAFEIGRIKKIPTADSSPEALLVTTFLEGPLKKLKAEGKVRPISANVKLSALITWSILGH